LPIGLSLAPMRASSMPAGQGRGLGGSSLEPLRRLSRPLRPRRRGQGQGLVVSSDSARPRPRPRLRSRPRSRNLRECAGP
jgi:hypothetical protein